MKIEVVRDIPFKLDLAHLEKALHIESGSEDALRLAVLAGEAEAIARPMAAFGTAFVEDRGDDFIVADGITFRSRVLRVNIGGVYRIFPYLATCGNELEEWAGSLDDMLESYWAERMMEAALNCSLAGLNARLHALNPGKTVSMNPGSLPDWPLQEQARLFELLGEAPGAVGVRLTESFLMMPRKSISGIRFPSDDSFENCQLCPRENCPGRRAPYDEDLYRRKYAQEITVRSQK